MKNTDNEKLLEDIVSLSKRRGFIFPGSEIYGGFAGTYDFGPLGILLKKNIENIWRNNIIYKKTNCAEIDSSIVTHPKVWEASGHVGGFSDPLIECKKCNARSRVDHMLEALDVVADEKMSESDIQKLVDENISDLKCPSCKSNDFSPVRNFNLLTKTNLGDFTGTGDNPSYLRGETAQGIYINYKNVLDTGFYKIPFGIGQIGKAFRNEIAPRQFIFRKREFEQMEFQYFVSPEHAAEEYEKLKIERMSFYVDVLGFDPEHLRFKQHDNLVFYAKDAWDIEYKYPFGWAELEGVHHRSDYDLSQHQEFSGQKLTYTDPLTNEKYIPYVLESSVGLDRMILAILCEYYREDTLGEGQRVYLALPRILAPIKASISPLLRNKEELKAKAEEVFSSIKGEFLHVMYDDNGNIGKRYRRQDEIGTPYCVTIDFDTLEDNTVTVRDRDTGEQERMDISKLTEYLS
ncbi:MAG: glycyl-tRNA synthetase [Flavobacteriaceae bacterium]|jgi:glycyl-tRNA synthetase